MALFWNSPLGPFIWLVGGASALLVLGKYKRNLRLSDALPTIVAGVAIVLWLALRLQAEQPTLLWSWRTELGWEASLRVRMDGWAWLAGFGILLCSFVAVALPGWRRRPGFVDPRVWVLLTAAVAVLVVLSGSWMTLLAAWILLMFVAGLIVGESAGAVWTMGALSAMLLLLAPLVNGAGSFGASVENLPLNIQAQFLVVLAAMMPMAVYPFHGWLGLDSSRSSGRQLALQLLPGLAAFYLLGRFDLPLLSSQAWILLIVTALFGSALAAWASQDTRRSWSFMLINRSTWAILVLGLARVQAPAGGILPLATLALGAALWTAAGVAQWRYNWRWPTYLGILVLYGFPLTPGFRPNLLLSNLAGASTGLLALLLVILAQSLLVAALFLRRHPKPEETGTPGSFAPYTLALTLALTGGLAIWWGVFPEILLRLAGSSADMLGGVGIGGWILILLPLALGALLALADQRLFANLRGWQENVAQLAGLGWLYALIQQALGAVAYPLGFVADLIDGAGQFGWVLFAVLIALVLFAT